MPNSFNKLLYCRLKNPTAFPTPLTAAAKPLTASVNTLPIALAIASKSSEFSSINTFKSLNDFLRSSKNFAPATT